MRKRRVVAVAVGTLIIGLASGAPVAAGHDEPQDVVTGFIDGQVCDEDGCTIEPIEVDARSGPSGEDATGTLVLQGLVRGTVTCLAVSGNRATIGYEIISGISGIYGLISVVDNDAIGQPDEIAQTFRAGPSPSICPTTVEGTQPASGDLDVRDVLPGPASKRDCFDGGWRRFGFENQGQCVKAAPRHTQ